jgi:apolipoprotein N-acyltransferase
VSEDTEKKVVGSIVIENDGETVRYAYSDKNGTKTGEVKPGQKITLTGRLTNSGCLLSIVALIGILGAALK